MLSRLRQSAFFRDNPRLNALLRNAGMLMTGNAANGVLSLIYLAVITRALGLEQFSLYGLYIAYIGLFTRLTTFQTWQGLIAFGTPAHENNDRGLLRDLLVGGWILDLLGGIAGYSLALLGAYLVPLWFGLGIDATTNVAIVATVLIFNWRNIPTALLRIYDAFLPQALFQNLTSALQLIVVTYLFLLGEDRVVVYLIVTTINNIISQLAYFGYAAWRAHKDGLFSAGTVQLTTLRQRCPGIMRFVLSTNGDGFVRVLRDIDIFIVNALLGVAAAGLYRIAKLLTRAMGQVTGPFYQSIYPELSRFNTNSDYNGMRALMRHSSVILGCMTFAGWMAFILFGELLLDVAFGSEYIAAYSVAAWSIAGMVVWGATHTLSPALLAWQRADTALLVNLITTSLYVIALYAFTSLFGLPGAGMALLAFYILWGIVMLMIVGRHLARLERPQ